MAISYSWKPSQGRASSPRLGVLSERPGGRFLAGLTLGLMAAVACEASGWAGATRDDGPAAGTSAPETPGAPSAQPKPVWQTDYDKALALAAERKRPVLLRFSAEWCPPCQVMDRSVYPDQNVKKALAERVVPVLLDIDQEQNVDLARRYGVREIPALLLVNADGEVLDRGGFMSAEALVKFLRGS